MTQHPKSSRKTQPHKNEDADQSKRFIEVAREAEADETEEGADRAFNNVTTPKRKSGTGRNESE